MQIKHGQTSKNLALFQNRSTFEGRYGVDSANLVLFLDQYDKRTGVLTATWDDLSGYSISGQDNDMKQATAANQPSVNAGSNRDFGGDDYMHQEIFDTNQGNMTFVADGGTAEFRDDGQDFSDWETATGNAAYMLVVTTDNGVSWGYMGEANNSNQDIDIYSDIALTTRGWKARTTPQATPDTAASYEVLKTDFQITSALSVFVWPKPDDGQPPATQILLSKSHSADGFRSWAINIQGTTETGKIRAAFSSDGASNSEHETTDDAFFSNGQETWHHIGFVYNGTTCVIYGDAVALASTTGAGGIPAALYDVSEKLTIGAISTPGLYFAGLIGPTIVASRAYSAGEVLRLYHGDAKRLP